MSFSDISAPVFCYNILLKSNESHQIMQDIIIHRSNLDKVTTDWEKYTTYKNIMLFLMLFFNI